jgi:hypothetical protein
MLDTNMGLVVESRRCMFDKRTRCDTVRLAVEHRHGWSMKKFKLIRALARARFVTGFTKRPSTHTRPVTHPEIDARALKIAGVKQDIKPQVGTKLTSKAGLM